MWDSDYRVMHGAFDANVWSVIKYVDEARGKSEGFRLKKTVCGTGR